MRQQKKKTILLTGGGTMGSVSPLLAIVDTCRAQNLDYNFLWIGTKTGPEKRVVDLTNIEWREISSGKLRRYFSWQNFFDLGNIFLGFWQSFWILLLHRPQIIITAGSYVSVPVVFAGWLLRIPILVHQLDYKAGLANLIMSKLATKITTTFIKSLQDYPSAIRVGSLLRQTILNPPERKTAQEFFGLDPSRPSILIFGGSTGAKALNSLLIEDLDELLRFCQIIHLTGKKTEDILLEKPRYFSFRFLDNRDMVFAFQAVDLVIARAGLGTLMELTYLAKPSIIIPLPNSHQELNAKAIQGKNSAIVLDEKKINSTDLLNIIQEVLYNNKLLQQLSHNIKKTFPVGNEKMLDIIQNIIDKK